MEKADIDRAANKRGRGAGDGAGRGAILSGLPAPELGPSMSTSLAVIIVTYNSAEALPGLLETLPAGLAGIGRSEIVVVDNASADGSAELAEAHPMHPRVVRTGRNGGYAAGINAGTAAVPMDADLLILNPDIRLRPGAAKMLVERLGDPGVGAAAPRILHEDGGLVHSIRREPSIATAWADALLGDRLGRRLARGETVLDPAAYRSDRLIDWGSGAALAIAARARARVGQWDETFFLYSEEVDYQRRLRDAGLAVAFVAGAEVVHIGGDYRRNPDLYALLTANRIRYYARHHGPAATAAFRLAVLTGEALRCLPHSSVHGAGLLAALTRRASLSPANPKQRQEASRA